jgi:O-methyltransferase
MNKTLANLLHTRPLFNILELASQHFQMLLLKFYRDPAAIAVIQNAFREADLQMNPLDAYALYSIVHMQASIPGSMAEVGMYRGGSARIICSLKGAKKFYGFDTFQGLPGRDHQDEKWFRAKQFSADKQVVAASLSGFKDVVLTEGVFPASGSVLDGQRLSFANLDVDLYSGMISSLNFLWDKLSDRGVILIHDAHLSGVKKAITEFLENQEAMRFDAGCSQAALIKIANAAERRQS